MAYTYEQIIFLSQLKKGQPFAYEGRTITPTEEEIELSGDFFRELETIIHAIGTALDSGRLPQETHTRLEKIKSGMETVTAIGTENDKQPDDEQLEAIFADIEGLGDILGERIPTADEKERQLFGRDISVCSILESGSPGLGVTLDSMFERNYDKLTHFAGQNERDLAAGRQQRGTQQSRGCNKTLLHYLMHQLLSPAV